MKFILRLIISALSIILVAYLVPDIEVNSFWAALFMALILGIVNALIRPFVLLLTLPVNLLTLGIFTLVINALMFWLASALSFGVEIGSFAAAFWGALIVFLVSWFSNHLLRD